MASEKVIQLARKLKALAEQGVGGEKVNAEKMLTKLLKEHNISIEEIEGELIKDHIFPVREEQKKLFFQIVSSVIGTGFPVYRVKRTTKPIKFVLKITASQAVEIYAKFDFYWPAFQKELKTLHMAFAMKHNLYPTNSEGIDAENISDEELERYAKAAAMQENLSDHVFRKQLT